MILISRIKILLLKLFTLFVFFLPSVSYALEGFCFSANTSLKSVKSYSQTILAPGDKVFDRKSKNCLEFQISPNRRELVRKWISQKYKISSTYSEGARNTLSQSETIVVENCRLKIERVSKGKAQKTNVDVGKRNGLLQQIQSSSGVRTSSMLLGKGFHGSLRVGFETVYLTCIGKTGVGYNVAVSLDSPTSSLRTTVFVSSGKKVNIGQVVNSLNDKQKSLGTNKGLSVEKTKGKSTYDYFLMAQ